MEVISVAPEFTVCNSGLNAPGHGSKCSPRPKNQVLFNTCPLPRIGSSDHGYEVVAKKWKPSPSDEWDHRV